MTLVRVGGRASDASRLLGLADSSSAMKGQSGIAEQITGVTTAGPDLVLALRALQFARNWISNLLPPGEVVRTGTRYPASPMRQPSARGGTG